MPSWKSANLTSPNFRVCHNSRLCEVCLHYWKQYKHTSHNDFLSTILVMKLTHLNWSTYRIPFRSPFITAHGALTERVGVLVAVHTDAGFVGNGEIAPLPAHNGAHLAEALHALSRLVHELRGRDIADILRFLVVQCRENQLPVALLCGLETALLDVCGQASGQSIAELLVRDYPCEQASGQSVTPRTRIPVNAVISGVTTEMAVTKAQSAIAAGFTCLKLKVMDASQATIERMAAIRAAIGSVPRLRLDANEGWNFEQACWMLTQCATYDIQYVEQPLPASDLTGMARLRRISPIPLAADEALSGLTSARRVLDAEAADVLILKPQLAGGLRVCRQIIQQASQRRIACVITSTLEAGIGVAAALHLAAASPEVTMACGLATLDLLEDDLLYDGLPVRDGTMCVPIGPGLGVCLKRSL